MSKIDKMSGPKRMVEKARRYVASNRTDKEISATATFVLSGINSISQAEIARNPRPNAFRQLLTEYLRHHQNAEIQDILDHLHNQVYAGVIEEVTEDVIEWKDFNGKTKKTKVKNLPKRVSEIRQTLKSSG